MKLSKIIALCLCAVLALSFAGCSKSPNEVKQDELNLPDFTVNATDKESEENTDMTEEKTPTYRKYSPTDEFVKALGRTYTDQNNTRWILQSAGGVEFETNGTDVRITFVCNDDTATSSNPLRYAVYVNGEKIVDKMMTENEVTLGIDLPTGKNTVTFLRLTEAGKGVLGIKDISVYATEDIKPTPDKDLKIEFIGDSITCAYGVDDEDRNHNFSTFTEDATKSYAYKTAQILNADYSMVCYSGNGIVSGYSSNGEKNEGGLLPPYYEQTAKGWHEQNKAPWDFTKFVPDIVVINLGTNDNSYVKGDATKTQEYIDGYIDFLKQIRGHYANAHIVCTIGPMNVSMFEAIEKAAATYTAETGDTNLSCLKMNKITADEGYAADWHPTEASQTRSADEMVAHLITVSEKAKAAFDANN